MLIEELCQEVEAYASRLRESHPLILRARRGELSPAAVATYVSNIRYSIRNTYGHLQRARSRAQELGLENLALFFEQKSREEYGHDIWAEQDLERLRHDFHVKPLEPSPSTAELMRYLDAVIARDPRCYLAYIFFAEYLTVLAGSDFVSALDHECGIPASHLSVIARHVELDQHHVAAALAELSALAQGVDLDSFGETLSDAMRYFERSCLEVSQIAA